MSNENQITEQYFVEALVLQQFKRRIHLETVAATMRNLGFSDDIALQAFKNLGDKFDKKPRNSLPTCLEYLQLKNKDLTEEKICEAILYQGISSGISIEESLEWLDKLRFDEDAMDNALRHIPRGIQILNT